MSFDLSSVKEIRTVQIEIYLEKGTGRNLECVVTGPDYGGKIQKQKHPNLGWAGMGWDGFVYLVKDAPPGKNRYAFIAKLIDP